VDSVCIGLTSSNRVTFAENSTRFECCDRYAIQSRPARAAALRCSSQALAHARSVNRQCCEKHCRRVGQVHVEYRQ
jgi:hypothetical protein